MIELTILMPCLNEAETLAVCIGRAQRLLALSGITGEVLISDNGSNDGSQEIARNLGARVVECPLRGYGAALQYGIQHAHGTYVLMGDSDDSYHFDTALPLIERLKEGFDVCMGTRLKGTIMPGAMPTLNRYLGNPVLTGIGKLLFRTGISDFHCGMRAFDREKILALGLVTTGMEWATEMVIKAGLSGLKITEVPITLFKDGRNRPPHLRRWRDGWRHLRFMLLHSPFWLFIVPGTVLLGAGTLGSLYVLILTQAQTLPAYDVSRQLVMSCLVVLGTQILFSGLFATLYSHLNGILPADGSFRTSIRRLTLEKLLIASIMLLTAGVAGAIAASCGGATAGGPAQNSMILSFTAITVAIQSAFNGFMLSILFLKTNPPKPCVDE
ncbi:MAG: glycosyltransferase family 2 protein [Desulfuromonadaceae bacterium]|nr:glycosyltransferase family 2 protein [Desulfuromonadaceae bacterium]